MGTWHHIASLWANARDHEIRLMKLEKKEKRVMAQIETIKGLVADLQREDGVLLQAFADLKAKVDAGEVVSTEDLTDLENALRGEVTKIDDAVQAPGEDTPTDPTPTEPNPPVEEPTTPTEPTTETAPGDSPPVPGF